MHLLYKHELILNQDVDKLMAELDDFEIEIDKRKVNQLMEMYEEKNTRILIDVNTGEDDIVQQNLNKVFNEKQKLREKINHVNETIEDLKERKIEINKKNDFLNAPKREN